MLNELADYLAFYLVDRERPQVLDLGTGTGSPAALVLRRIRNSSFIGIDTDPAMIVEARQRLAERTLFSVSCGLPH
jgi:trans-aconitate methyltransferase